MIGYSLISVQQTFNRLLCKSSTKRIMTRWLLAVDSTSAPCSTCRDNKHFKASQKKEQVEKPCINKESNAPSSATAHNANKGDIAANYMQTSRASAASSRNLKNAAHSSPLAGPEAAQSLTQRHRCFQRLWLNNIRVRGP